MGVFSFRDDYKVSPLSNKLSGGVNSDTSQGRVKKVYLDFGTKVTDGAANRIIPGAIEVELFSSGRGNSSITVFPENEKFLDLPLQTEIVDVNFAGSIPVYRRINLNKSINNGESGAGAASPNGTPQTGLNNFKSLGGAVAALASVGGNFGDYFKKEKIGRLKLFEGRYFNTI